MFGKKKIEGRVRIRSAQLYAPGAAQDQFYSSGKHHLAAGESFAAFAEAYADITKGAIAQEVFAPMDKVAQYNGLNVLGSTLPEGAICLCNGMTIFRRAAGEKHARSF